jgi:hypothetical protein
MTGKIKKKEDTRKHAALKLCNVGMWQRDVCTSVFTTRYAAFWQIWRMPCGLTRTDNLTNKWMAATRIADQFFYYV